MNVRVTVVLTVVLSSAPLVPAAVGSSLALGAVGAGCCEADVGASSASFAVVSRFPWSDSRV